MSAAYFGIGFTTQSIWLVVSTPLKNISQLGLFFPIYGWKPKKKCSKPPSSDRNCDWFTTQRENTQWNQGMAGPLPPIASLLYGDPAPGRRLASLSIQRANSARQLSNELGCAMPGTLDRHLEKIDVWNAWPHDPTFKARNCEKWFILRSYSDVRLKGIISQGRWS